MGELRNKKSIRPLEEERKPGFGRFRRIPELTSDEIKTLAAQLQIPQVELQAQIEYLKISQEELQQSRDKYQELYNSVPVGYFTIDRDFQVLEANATAAKLFGTTVRVLLRSKFLKFIAPSRESQDAFHLCMRKTFDDLSEHECELEMQRNDGVRFYAQLLICSKAGSSGQNKLTRIAVSDITGRKKAEIAFRESVERLRLTQIGADIGIWDWDMVTGELHWSEQVEILYGQKPGSIKTYQDWRRLVHPEDIERFEVQRDVAIAEHWPFDLEYRILRNTGDIQWINVKGTTFYDKAGNPVRILGISIDVTERKKADQALARANDELEKKVEERTQELAEANRQLKQYGRRIIQVQEEERKRIAYELHDDTAQYLSILKLEIEALIQSGKVRLPEILEKLEFLKKDAERAFNDVRRYSHELRPGVLEHLGLQAALDQITEDINKLKQVPVELHVEGVEPRVPEDVKLAFFRVAQEALNNARKYSGASQVNIELKFTSCRIDMAVSDDGVGFDSDETWKKIGSSGSLGLMSMKERANLINADLKIESSPGKGTRVMLQSKILF